MRAFDQAGDVGDHERAIVIAILSHAHDAEVRLQRGERIVGDFGLRRGDARNQRGLAGIGKSHQPDVGQQLQFQAQALKVAGLAVFVLRRSLVRGCREAGVAASAAPALGHDEAVAGNREIVQLFAGFGIVDDRANGGGNFLRSTVVPGLVAAFAVASALRFVLGIEAEVQQRIVVGAGDHGHVAAAAAIAAAGSAARHEFLATEREAAIAAVAGFHGNDDFIDKHEKPACKNTKGQRVFSRSGWPKPLASES